MNLYIDTEFDGFGGKLISMAIVSEMGEFYEVLSDTATDQWVILNVIPKLQKEPIGEKEFKLKLFYFLDKHEDITIVADWADDIKYFCECLIVSPGVMYSTLKINFVMDRRLSSSMSKVPHNALEDARAIKKASLDDAYFST